MEPCLRDQGTVRPRPPDRGAPTLAPHVRGEAPRRRSPTEVLARRKPSALPGPRPRASAPTPVSRAGASDHRRSARQIGSPARSRLPVQRRQSLPQLSLGHPRGRSRTPVLHPLGRQGPAARTPRQRHPLSWMRRRPGPVASPRRCLGDPARQSRPLVVIGFRRIAQPCSPRPQALRTPRIREPRSFRRRMR